jgi:rhodanese-related sulfurtransferase
MIMSDSLELTPQEASRLAKAGEGILIDVREPEEFAIARIDGARLVPMQSVPGELQKLEALADEAPLLVLCHHGVRSLQVVAWLRNQGLENSYSVAGGIDRWSRELDPAIPQY